MPKKRNRRYHEIQNSSSQRLSLHSDISQQSSQDIPSISKIYCDLDGVLCDFDAAVRDLSKGIPADLLPHQYMWSLIAKSEKFYERLPWTSDGQLLWNNIKHLQPTILTGVSMGKTCPIEKATWCSRELCVPTNHVCKASRGFQHTIVKGELKHDAINVITCWSKNKHFESGVGSILIDDRISLAAAWTAKGGIFIHHTKTEKTLQLLQKYGVPVGEHVMSPSIDVKK